MKVFRLLVFIAAIFQVNLSFGQWLQTDGPYGKTSALSLVTHDSLLMASTPCGYFSKHDLNDSWKLQGTLAFSVHTKIGSTLYVSADGIQKLDLSDQDEMFIKISSLTLESLASHDTVLYGGSKTMGFYQSIDQGYEWVSKNEGLPVDSIFVYFPPHYVYTNPVTALTATSEAVFCGTKKGVFRKSPASNTWQNANNGLPESEVTLFQSYNDTLFVAFTNLLYRSTDAGNTWSIFFESPSLLTDLLQYSQYIYAATKADGIYKISNDSQSWSSINSGLPELEINKLSIYNQLIVCGTESTGVYYFLNDQWVSNQPGMFCSYINNIAATSNMLFASDYSNVYLSEDRSSWLKANTPEIPSYPNLSSGINDVISRRDTILMSYNYSTPNYPYHHSFISLTADNGISWTNIADNIPYTGDDPYRIYIDNNRLYAYEDDRMFFTTNNGLQWSDISLPAQFCNMFYGFIVSDGIAFAAACGNSQLLRLDENNNWILANNGLPPDREPLALAKCDSALFAFVNVHGMYVSFDHGNSWRSAGEGLETNYSIYDFAFKDSLLFISTDYGVYATQSYGQNWAALNQGLKNKQVFSLEIWQDTLFAGTAGNGIWKHSLHNLNLGIPVNGETIKALRIIPNPASHFIRFENLPEGSIYSITDLMGQRVNAGEADESKYIDVSKIPSGIFIVTIHFEDKIQSAKLIVNR